VPSGAFYAGVAGLRKCVFTQLYIYYLSALAFFAQLLKLDFRCEALLLLRLGLCKSNLASAAKTAEGDYAPPLLISPPHMFSLLVLLLMFPALSRSCHPPADKLSKAAGSISILMESAKMMTVRDGFSKWKPAALQLTSFCV